MIRAAILYGPQVKTYKNVQTVHKRTKGVGLGGQNFVRFVRLARGAMEVGPSASPNFQGAQGWLRVRVGYDHGRPRAASWPAAQHKHLAEQCQSAAKE